MELFIRPAACPDLPELSRIESACFPPEEAASERSIRERLAAFPDCFLIAFANGNAVGLVNGCATDLPRIEDRLFEDASLHDPNGKNQMVFSLAVDPAFQGKGIGSALLSRFIEESRTAGRKSVVLTCKEEKLGYYRRFGFENKGVSGSVHGGAVWYDMVLPLD